MKEIKINIKDLISLVKLHGDMYNSFPKSDAYTQELGEIIERMLEEYDHKTQWTDWTEGVSEKTYEYYEEGYD